MKNQFVLLLSVLCLLLLSACNAAPIQGGTPSDIPSQQPATSPAPTGNADQPSFEDLIIQIEKTTQVNSDDLLTQFYRYNNAHPYELSMLPDYDVGQTPDWDNLTLYVFINNAANGGTAASTSTLSQEAFAETLKQYLGGIRYSDKSSAYLTYENGVYTAVPGDTMRHGYYRLTGITVDPNGVYEATFDGLFFGELEFSEDYDDASPNIKAIRDEAGVTETMQKGEFEDTLLRVFSKDSYADVLDMTERTVVRFTLSGNENYPFIYLSCASSEY